MPKVFETKDELKYYQQGANDATEGKPYSEPFPYEELERAGSWQDDMNYCYYRGFFDFDKGFSPSKGEFTSIFTSPDDVSRYDEIQLQALLDTMDRMPEDLRRTCDEDRALILAELAKRSSGSASRD